MEEKTIKGFDYQVEALRREIVAAINKADLPVAMALYLIKDIYVEVQDLYNYNIKKQAEEAGLTNVEIVIEYGSPKSIITRELSNVVNADLIICGATGLNAVERFLIGSVSEAIVRTAKCDVLVIRTPE